MRKSNEIVYSRFPARKLIYFYDKFASWHFIVPQMTNSENGGKDRCILTETINKTSIDDTEIWEISKMVHIELRKYRYTVNSISYLPSIQNGEKRIVYTIERDLVF